MPNQYSHKSSTPLSPPFRLLPTPLPSPSSSLLTLPQTPNQPPPRRHWSRLVGDCSSSTNGGSPRHATSSCWTPPWRTSRKCASRTGEMQRWASARKHTHTYTGRGGQMYCVWYRPVYTNRLSHTHPPTLAHTDRHRCIFSCTDACRRWVDLQLLCQMVIVVECPTTTCVCAGGALHTMDITYVAKAICSPQPVLSLSVASPCSLIVSCSTTMDTECPDQHPTGKYGSSIRYIHLVVWRAMSVRVQVTVAWPLKHVHARGHLHAHTVAGCTYNAPTSSTQEP